VHTERYPLFYMERLKLPRKIKLERKKGRSKKAAFITVLYLYKNR
jgi:hypothetical protein